MPQGKGTYGNKVGRPPKGNTMLTKDPVGDFHEKVKMGRAKEGGTKRQKEFDNRLTNTFVRANMMKESGEMAGYNNFVEANRMNRAKGSRSKLQSHDNRLTNIFVKYGKYNK